MGGNYKNEAWFKTILKIPINESFKNHIETANTTIGDQTIRAHCSQSKHTHKINWGWGWEEGEKSNVQIPKINTLFIWIFYKKESPLQQTESL